MERGFIVFQGSLAKVRRWRKYRCRLGSAFFVVEGACSLHDRRELFRPAARAHRQLYAESIMHTPRPAIVSRLRSGASAQRHPHQQCFAFAQSAFLACVI